MRKTGPGFLLLLVLLWLPGGCVSPQFNVPQGAPIVRVQVLANKQQVVLASNAPTAIKSSNESDWRRVSFGSGAPATVSSTGWRVGNVSFPPGELIIEPSAVASVRVDGAAYRGRYRLVPTANDKFDVVNDLDVDSYLMGVLPKELKAEWNLETYKAQAIAARTYALYEVRTGSASRHFDLFDDDRSQVYGGYGAESDKSRRAVADTSSVVVAYGPAGNEKIFKAYFSSCCGGVAQDVYDAFGEPNIPPLTERKVGALCNASSKFNWTPVVLSKAELTRRIRIWGTRRNAPLKDMGTLRTIEIAAVNDYQRPIRYYLYDSKGLRYALTAEELRWACNADANGGPVLPSGFFKPVASGDSINFTEGHGWGHAVGLCQWCANALAQQGKAHEDIVRFSYPGSVLVRAY